MKRTGRSSCLLALSLLVVAPTAWADDATPTAASQAPAPGAVARPVDVKVGPGDNSLNLNPIGFLVGAYSINYERLFDNTHGLLIEPGFSYSKDDNTKSHSFGLDVGYRWHWSHKQDSGFLGLNLSGYLGTGTAQVSDEKFTVNTRSFAVIGNVGRRFAWDSGFNITLRIGAGYASRKVTTDSKDPDAQAAVKLVDDLISLLPIALDSEASIGYIF